MAASTPSSTVVVVDTGRLLDESPAGKAGAAALQTRYDNDKARYDALREKGTTEKGRRQAEEAAAGFERQAFAELEAERAALARKVLEGARPLIAAVMKERGASIVVDARATIAFDGAIDITDLVLQRLSA
jgi:outer membrane protein